MAKVKVMDHPLIQHKIGILRKRRDKLQRIPGNDERGGYADVL